MTPRNRNSRYACWIYVFVLAVVVERTGEFWLPLGSVSWHGSLHPAQKHGTRLTEALRHAMLLRRLGMPYVLVLGSRVI